MSAITGNTVREVRELLGLSQAETADQLGVAKKTVYNWEARGEDALPETAGRRYALFARRLLTERGLALDVSQELRDKIGLTGRALLPAEVYAGVLDARRLDRNEEFARSGVELEIGLFAEKGAKIAALALDQGVDPSVVQELARSLVNIYVDSGAFATFTEGRVPHRGVRILSHLGDVLEEAGSLLVEAEGDGTRSRARALLSEAEHRRDVLQLEFVEVLHALDDRLGAGGFMDDERARAIGGLVLAVERLGQQVIAAGGDADYVHRQLARARASAKSAGVMVSQSPTLKAGSSERNSASSAAADEAWK